MQRIRIIIYSVQIAIERLSYYEVGIYGPSQVMAASYTCYVQDTTLPG